MVFHYIMHGWQPKSVHEFDFVRDVMGDKIKGWRRTQYRSVEQSVMICFLQWGNLPFSNEPVVLSPDMELFLDKLFEVAIRLETSNAIASLKVANRNKNQPR